MPSVVPGYEYDIFISYRHKDNKGEHWVSEFVAALRTELESTFKEDISIYFDENPHDGLLETHDVSKSLEGKLKCLVLIPIISQTYCDPKSYAWQHEFRAFNKLVTESDPYGREIKLKNGNVASRILPIKIHDLDEDDKQFLESELGSVLRGVEFIYKSAGVNRPLKPNDDRTTNLNHTYYRDQINKVANAVKEIISGIKNAVTALPNKEQTLTKHASRSGYEKSTRRQRNIIVILLTTVLAIVAYSIFQYSSARINSMVTSSEKSIAVLPFKNLGANENDEYFSDGFTEEVTSRLSKVAELKVMSSTSVEQYKSTNKTPKSIGEELDVAYLLEGSVRKLGNRFRILVRLSQAETGFQVWSGEYEKEMFDVFQMPSDISREVTDALKIVLTKGEVENIESHQVVGLTAYDFYLKGRNELMDFREVLSIKGLSHIEKAIDLFIKAIQADPRFARAYTGLGVSLLAKGDRGNMLIEKVFLDSAKNLADKALSLDSNLDEAYFILGLYYNQKADDDKAIEYLNKALQVNPNYSDALFRLGWIYTNFKRDFILGLPLMEKAIQLRGPELAQNLRFTGLAYEFLGLHDITAEYQATATQLDGDSTWIFSSWSWNERAKGNYESALKLAMRAYRTDSIDFFATDNQAWVLTLLGRYEEALKARLKWNTSVGTAVGMPMGPANRTGHLYWQLGDKETAMKYFNAYLTFGEQSIAEERVNAREGYTVYDMAGIYAFLGDKEKSYKYLDMVNELKFIPSYLLDVINQDPMFESLKNEDRFKKIKKDMEEKNQRERDRVWKWLQEKPMKKKLDPKM